MCIKLLEKMFHARWGCADTTSHYMDFTHQGFTYLKAKLCTFMIRGMKQFDQNVLLKCGWLKNPHVFFLLRLLPRGADDVSWTRSLSSIFHEIRNLPPPPPPLLWRKKGGGRSDLMEGRADDRRRESRQHMCRAEPTQIILKLQTCFATKSLILP